MAVGVHLHIQHPSHTGCGIDCEFPAVGKAPAKCRPCMARNFQRINRPADFRFCILASGAKHYKEYNPAAYIDDRINAISAGMDAKSQAKQMISSGLQIPGFRKDERVLERLLNRYIWPLTIMGGMSVGFLAAFADITGALGSGTGILLTVMIVYRLYEDIARQHMMDMNPMMRKFMGG